MQQTKPKGLTTEELDQLAINTIRTLSIDAVQQANSGHPGTPMALAPLVYVIWNEVMRYDPQDPIWPNRDRFVLSNGHASMLLWSVLFLTGTRAVNAQYERLGEPAVTLDAIRHFRQLGSKAPGHPEYHLVAGVEATTGPLGQGIATSVGMAIARKWLASRYNKPGFDLFDYNIYAICGDGCMMEGVSSEAASLAGHLALDGLCRIYDNNHITIDGKTKITFTEDVAARFLAYHWNVLRVGDANDLQSIEEALAVFRKTKDRPTLIILDSHIGYGSPHKVDTAAAHGEPLGEEEVKLVKRAYHWPENAKFLVPDGVMEHFADGIGQRGGKARRDWEAMFAKYRERFPGSRHGDRSDATAGTARRVGSQSAELSAGCEGHRRARRFEPSAQCARAEHSMVSRRLRRSRLVEQDGAQVRQRRGIRTRHARRPQYSFRHPRACDGGDHQRSFALQAAGVRIDIPHLQRLCPAGYPALRADGAADDYRFHPRCHGRR